MRCRRDHERDSKERLLLLLRRFQIAGRIICRGSSAGWSSPADVLRPGCGGCRRRTTSEQRRRHEGPHRGLGIQVSGRSGERRLPRQSTI
jgi:hypothetical protein